jgi:hypothetical protein
MEKNGRIEQWAEQLLGKGEIIAETDKTSARDAAVAAVRAHFFALQTNADLETLKTKSESLIRDCHDSGVRAGTAPGVPAKSLSDSLFDLSEDELLASRLPKGGVDML